LSRQEEKVALSGIKMASNRKKRVIQTARKREKRGRVYLAVAIVAIVIIGAALYVYASSQANNTPSIVYAKLNTSQGVIEVELYHNSAPKTVDNFVNLANSGFYNNLVWHRIAYNFVIQTGDPNSRNALNNATWGQGGSSQTIPLEIDSSLHNYAGYLGMASTSPGVGITSQFFINLKDTNSQALDGKYTVFAKVISGMNVANAIGNLPIYNPPDGQPINPANAMLNSVTISNTP
jgi:cyclophilin family peptidyl-prolyl cis-trans isomerase